MIGSTAGYDAAADAFIAARGATGGELVAAWARASSPGARVLDVGAGHGWPVTQALVAANLDVSAIEPSPRLATALTERLPDVFVAIERAQDSALLAQRWDAVTMVGVIFLLEPSDQRALLGRLAGALTPGGRLLFSAPWQAAAWTDGLTGCLARSLGRTAYGAVLETMGVRVTDERTDEGGNHYFLCEAGDTRDAP